MTKCMTSKERVLTVFARQEPDRVPINYLCNPGIDGRLKAHYGLAADDDEGLRRVLGVDFRAVHAPYVGPRLHAEMPGIAVDPLWGIHRRYIEHESGAYWDYCDFPLRNADEEIVAAWPMPSPDDYDYSQIAEQCRLHGQYAINGAAGFGDIINGNGFLRGMEQVLIDLVTDDPAGLLLADRRMEIQIEVTRRMLEAAQGGVDFLWLGEDLGTQRGPTISMQIFRKHIRPRYQAFCDLAKAHDLPVMMHCCGGFRPLFPQMIRAGLDGVHALQPYCTGMDPAGLKRDFGAQILLNGAIDSQSLIEGTADDARDLTRRVLDIMSPGGGYVAGASHDYILEETPLENVLAMLDTIREYRRG